MARQLHNEGYGIDAIVGALREQGITCSDYLCQKLSAANLDRKTKTAAYATIRLTYIGGQGRDRTGDTRIFSPLLYQLSYLATSVFEMVGAQGFEPWTQ